MLPAYTAMATTIRAVIAARTTQTARMEQRLGQQRMRAPRRRRRTVRPSAASAGPWNRKTFNLAVLRVLRVVTTSLSGLLRPHPEPNPALIPSRSAVASTGHPTNPLELALSITCPRTLGPRLLLARTRRRAHSRSHVASRSRTRVGTGNLTPRPVRRKAAPSPAPQAHRLGGPIACGAIGGRRLPRPVSVTTSTPGREWAQAVLALAWGRGHKRRLRRCIHRHRRSRHRRDHPRGAGQLSLRQPRRR
mmetsp:Transcript_26186/g.73258  ORF Transcript_26186/g.73258 Transcript_26186/m.73258 type:complete len:248 (-) Transcript_26186:609-1352(-)